ncbi:MAG: succinyl-diaminopimelate desuccinylase [Gammaproteobacteria bacterium TMED226]|nr:MAG: succinyl-diaminopimelate desuccinylase [Gammaproteobacteria bacterium TMED226]|tara:strand:- start:5932 stop:7059 length:1128 start_codon:yes stop_codon:yes gene_type:complete
MIELLQKLIQIKSISPKDMGCFDLIEMELEKLNFNCERINYQNVENLYATFGTSGKLFCFLGHTDVVPTGPEEKWKYPPFSATIDGDLLYGRGTADMKAPVSAFIESAKEFLNLKEELNFRLAILLTSNEEGTSKDGFIDKIIDRMIQDDEIIDFCLVGEPTSNEKVADCVRIGRRGSLGGFLKIYGKQGHVAYPEKVVNPILLSGDLISKLNNKIWDDGNAAFDPTSFQISNIKSGTGAHNVVPGELEIIFNFRFSTESSEESLKSDFESILNELNLNYELDWDLNGNPYYTENNFFKNIVSDSIKEVTGYSPELNAKGGTSDGRFIAKMGTEVIELGPVNNSIHQIDEHVKISELWTLKDIYTKILTNLNLNS